MRISLIIILITSSLASQAQDTLYFKLSNPFNTVKDPNGKYIRKAIQTKDSAWLAYDYNWNNTLIVRGYYSDTNFKTKLFCHEIYNQAHGWREEIRCYKDGSLDGIRAGFNKSGDTLWKNLMAENKVIEEKHFPGYIPRQVIYEMVEVESEFPSGRRAWIQFLQDNIRYPKQARKKKIEGEVVVQFIIDKDGKVTNVEVLHSVDPLLDQEAVRLIKSSPDWIPAQQNGKPVKSSRKQPIIFSLGEE